MADEPGGRARTERAGTRFAAEPGEELTGAQRAVAALREGIRTGRYVAGQRLVETDLTRELGVGRNSLREAFARLRTEGLVLVEPHRGASIRRLTRDEVAQLYDISEVLEGLAAREAASRISVPGNAELLSSVTESLRVAAGADNVIDWIDESARFHRVIADLAGNARLTELVDQLHIQTFSFQLRHAQRRGLDAMRDSSLAEHVALAEAIQHGDATTAETLMRDHLRSAKRRFLELPDADFG
jgi:DNA-binding GntR family transcriptional regulator